MLRLLSFRSFLLTAFVLSVASWSARADEPERTPDEWLTYFSRNWKEGSWANKSRKRPKGYMLPLDDAGWQARMQSIHGLVSHGKESVPALLNALESGDVPRRILAAQVLGYLAPDAPAEPLLKAIENDAETAVRLYAVDALGMQGAAAATVDWNALKQKQKNRDVKKHINYAIERKNKPVSDAVVRALKEWDPATINSAEAGKPAPNFELTSANGEAIKLSQYRGQKNVVLVFIYGDT